MPNIILNPFPTITLSSGLDDMPNIILNPFPSITLSSGPGDMPNINPKNTFLAIALSA